MWDTQSSDFKICKLKYKLITNYSTLAQYLAKVEKDLDEREILTMFQQMSSALKYIHDNQILHRWDKLSASQRLTCLVQWGRGRGGEGERKVWASWHLEQAFWFAVIWLSAQEKVLTGQFLIFQMRRQYFLPGCCVQQNMRFGRTKSNFVQTLSDDRLLFTALYTVSAWVLD